MDTALKGVTKIENRSNHDDVMDPEMSYPFSLKIFLLSYFNNEIAESNNLLNLPVRYITDIYKYDHYDNLKALDEYIVTNQKG